MRYRFPILMSCCACALAACGDGDSDKARALGTGGSPDSGVSDAAPACEPGTYIDCYSGSPTTNGVGSCHGGVRVCLPDGSGYGDCLNEVTPSAETCSTPVDDDCDGELNEDGSNCVCVPGSTENCYSGPSTTSGVGACATGTRACNLLGTAWLDCINEVLPIDEQCDTPVDDDCDGSVNEAPGCSCTPGSTGSCYSGPSGTLDVGACKSGTQVCESSGQGFGACLGEVPPVSETCSTSVDDDCDGELNEEGAGCVCVPGTSESCYSGPTGTASVGACTLGSRTCDALGTAWLPCVGEVLPTAEQCATTVDDDCDGAVNEEGADCICSPGGTLPCYTGPSGTLDIGPCKQGTQTCAASGAGYSSCVGDVSPTVETCSTYANEDCSTAASCVHDVAALIGVGLQGDTIQPWLLSGGATSDPHVFIRGKWLRYDDFGTQKQNVAIPEYFEVHSVTEPPALAPKTALLAGRGLAANLNFGAGQVVTGALVVAEYDAAGVKWAKGFTGSGAIENIRAVHDASGTYYVAGRCLSSTMDLGFGPFTCTSNVFVTSLQPTSGQANWSRVLHAGTSSAHLELKGAYAYTGELWLAGNFSATLDAGGASPPLVSAGGKDIFLASLSTTDGVTTSQVARFGGTGNDTILLARPTSGQSAGIAGTTSAGFAWQTNSIPPGMFVGRVISTSLGWFHSYPNCTPELVDTTTGDSNDVFQVMAKCSVAFDPGNGMLPAGRVLLAFDMTYGMLISGRPIPTNLQTVGITTIETTRWLLGKIGGGESVDFGTGPLMPLGGSNYVLARFWNDNVD